MEKHESPADICRPFRIFPLHGAECLSDVCFSAGKHRPHFAMLVCVISTRSHTLAALMPYLVIVSNFLPRVVYVSPGLFLCVVVLGRACSEALHHVTIYGKVSSFSRRCEPGSNPVRWGRSARQQILNTSSQERQTTLLFTVLS